MMNDPSVLCRNVGNKMFSETNINWRIIDRNILHRNLQIYTTEIRHLDINSRLERNVQIWMLINPSFVDCMSPLTEFTMHEQIMIIISTLFLVSSFSFMQMSTNLNFWEKKYIWEWKWECVGKPKTGQSFNFALYFAFLTF